MSFDLPLDLESRPDRLPAYRDILAMVVGLSRDGDGAHPGVANIRCGRMSHVAHCSPGFALDFLRRLSPHRRASYW